MCIYIYIPSFDDVRLEEHRADEIRHIRFTKNFLRPLFVPLSLFAAASMQCHKELRIQTLFVNASSCVQFDSFEVVRAKYAAERRGRYFTNGKGDYARIARIGRDRSGADEDTRGLIVIDENADKPRGIATRSL